VQPVEETIKEEWFQEAIRDKDLDLIVVAGHAQVRGEAFKMIYKAIRQVRWDMPIQFFGGHYHVRDYHKFDSNAYAIASGRYMETIGFQSITGLSTGKHSEDAQKRASQTFSRRYIDNNLFSLSYHSATNATTFPTASGQAVSDMIHKARKSMRLDTTFGCAPQDYWTNRAPYPHDQSIFSLLDGQVLPDMVVEEKRKHEPRMIIVNTGSMRFDIFRGAFTRDSTFIVSPFTSGFRFIKGVPYDKANRLLTLLNNEGSILKAGWSDSQYSMRGPSAQAAGRPQVVLPPPESESVVDHSNFQQKLLADEPDLAPGYTTHDDAGTEGDDTLHSQISFYNVPNCIEARVGTTESTADDQEGPVEKVDLIYLEFIEPWILLALRFLGTDYQLSDANPYMEKKDFTSLIAEWVQMNWPCEE